jgi:hypothetical protein
MCPSKKLNFGRVFGRVAYHVRELRLELLARALHGLCGPLAFESFRFLELLLLSGAALSVA